MGAVTPLLAFLLRMFSGWLRRQQLMVIEFLQAENRMLKERLRGKRIRYTNAERVLVARKEKTSGKRPAGIDTLVSTDSLMRWHRRLIAQKLYLSKLRSPRRPGIMCEISELIVLHGA